MQQNMIMFDITNHQIGVIRANCSYDPNMIVSDTEIYSHNLDVYDAASIVVSFDQYRTGNNEDLGMITSDLLSCIMLTLAILLIYWTISKKIAKTFVKTFLKKAKSEKIKVSVTEDV